MLGPCWLMFRSRAPFLRIWNASGAFSGHGGCVFRIRDRSGLDFGGSLASKSAALLAAPGVLDQTLTRRSGLPHPPSPH